jgi:iron(III) transport system ATP-binding protein
MATVSLSGITKKFGEVAAVDGLDLEIGDGEFVSLLGPSGCGKTTTLRLIAGFLQPEAGEIRVNREVVSSASILVPPERRNMSMIFQSYAVWPHMTVFQNVAYGLKLRGWARADIEKKVRQMLSVVRLDALAERYPGELSGGQQQRVALARALVVEPQTLLLDEPLSNLDANLREEMRFEIRRLHEEFHITTIYVTHDQAEAMVTSDRIAVMNQGRIDQVGTPEEIFERPRTRFVAEFIGKANLLPGRVEEGGRVRLGEGISLRLARGFEGRVGESGYVCLRPHHAAVLRDETEAKAWAERGYNVFVGSVKRRIYLGESMDYLFQLSADGLSLRVICPTEVRLARGERAFIAAHPDRCVLVRNS